MLKKLLGKKTKIIAFFLFVVCTSICILNPFSNCIMRAKALGEIYESIYYLDLDASGFQDGEIDEYLSNSDVSDEYIDYVDNYVEETYKEYIRFDDYNYEYLTLDIGHFEELYGVGFLSWNFDITDYSEEEAFEIATLRMINRNISIMNELVDEKFGYINDEYELIFYIEDEYVAQWELWGVKVKWNKVTMNMDSDAAIVVALVTLGLRTVFHGWDMRNTMISLQDDAVLVSVLQETLLVIPSDIASGIAGLFTDPVISILANGLSILLTIAGNSSIFMKVITLAISIALPSIVDGALVLYNACKYDRGVEVKGCWIPTWKDKWGISIKSI